MSYPKLRELVEALKALVTGPYTSKFPKKIDEPAERFRGKPQFEDTHCIGCGTCSEMCPSGAMVMVDEPAEHLRRMICHYDKCIFCGQCEAYCLTKEGIHLTKEYDLAGFDRETLKTEVKKELVICEGCRVIIGTKEHMSWLARKLGPLSYGNYSLILTAQKELKLPDTGEREIQKGEEEKPPSRSGLFRILCPKCRREIVLFDKYGSGT